MRKICREQALGSKVHLARDRGGRKKDEWGWEKANEEEKVEEMGKTGRNSR